MQYDSGDWQVDLFLAFCDYVSPCWGPVLTWIVPPERILKIRLEMERKGSCKIPSEIEVRGASELNFVAHRLWSLRLFQLLV